MITLYPIHRVLAIVAAIYAVLVGVCASLLHWGTADSAIHAWRWSAGLGLLIFLFIAYGWRKVWALIPALNRWVYPDLNGTWRVTMHWNWNGGSGTKEAVAHIRQDFVRMSIELLSDESESETLMVKPKHDPESRRSLLFYVYRNEPKQKSGAVQQPHTGAAILKVNPSNLNCLEGNYFTDRETRGHYLMERCPPGP